LFEEHSQLFEECKSSYISCANVSDPADIKLLSDSKKVSKKAANGGIDKITGEEVSLVTAARANAVIEAFEPIVKEKQARIYASELAKKAKENIKMTTENAKKSLMNPVVWG
jgi:hypothetical protein